LDVNILQVINIRQGTNLAARGELERGFFEGARGNFVDKNICIK
jgi:hypothetical protein